MEKSRAIELLKLAIPIKALTQQEYADFVEAVNMGMDALEQPTSPDTIDRKAELDALRRCQTYLYDARDPELKIELSSAEAAINNLPTIQPVATDTNVGDAISRQAAIEKFAMTAPQMSVIRIYEAVEILESMPTIQPEPQWIPVSERLPEAEYPVIVTWMNNDPASYYQYILGKHYTGVAHYKNNKWYWYSSVTEDVLMEYGRCDSEEFDEAIEVIAWMPLPSPYQKGATP